MHLRQRIQQFFPKSTNNKASGSAADPNSHVIPHKRHYGRNHLNRLCCRTQTVVPVVSNTITSFFVNPPKKQCFLDAIGYRTGNTTCALY